MYLLGRERGEQVWNAEMWNLRQHCVCDMCRLTVRLREESCDASQRKNFRLGTFGGLDVAVIARIHDAALLTLMKMVPPTVKRAIASFNNLQQASEDVKDGWLDRQPHGVERSSGFAWMSKHVVRYDAEKNVFVVRDGSMSQWQADILAFQSRRVENERIVAMQGVDGGMAVVGARNLHERSRRAERGGRVGRQGASGGGGRGRRGGRLGQPRFRHVHANGDEERFKRAEAARKCYARVAGRLNVSGLEALVQRRENVYIQGRAGTGKSKLICGKLVKWLEDAHGVPRNCSGDGRVVKTSTSGVSSICIGGRTLHSWAGIKRGL